MADPVPNDDSGGGGDQFCPLDSPVDDVWLHVLSYLDDDPRDLINLADTCVFFQDLVETSRPAGCGAPREACRLEEVLPFIFKWLYFNETYMMRLVCLRLRNRMDKILENGARITTYQNLDLFPRLLPIHPQASERLCSFDWDHLRFGEFDRPGVILRTVESIANYQDFLEGQLPPQIGRRHYGHRIVASTISVEDFILIGLDGGPSPAAVLTNNTVFLQRALEFFRAFRHVQIKSVIVQVAQNRPLVSVYDFVRNFCEALPHLQCLDIKWVAYTTVPLPSHTVEEEHELQEFVGEHHLPPLPNLERFSIMYPVPLPFLCQIAEAYGSQLRILGLDLSDIAFTLEQDTALPEYQFPVLEEIKLRMEDRCIRLMQAIKAPSAKTLRLIPVRSNEFTGNSLVDFVNAIDNFPSMITLQLNLCLPLREPRVTDSWLKPHQGLRNLLIITSHPLPPLRFFTKWFPNVEWISVKVDTHVNVQRDKDLKLLWAGRFQESSTWREAPKLETVRMRIFWDLENQRKIWYRKREVVPAIV